MSEWQPFETEPRSAIENDNLDTLLLLSMDSGQYKSQGYSFHGERMDGLKRQNVDYSSVINLPDRYPENAYTFDASGDRLYTGDLDMLLHHPFTIIGNSMETILFDGEMMKWSKIEFINRPRRFVAIGKAAKWVAIHYRTHDIRGNQDYMKEVFPLHRTGKVLPMKIEGYNIDDQNPAQAQQHIVMACSLVEDAMRPGVLLAKASITSSIMFPIEYGAHKDFFALRDSPSNTPSGRRNPILHFCQKHLRQTPSGDVTPVDTHWRGRSSVTIDGMSIELSANGFGPCPENNHHNQENSVMKTEARASRTRITQAEFFRLCRYLEGKEERFKDMKQADIIKAVKSDLGLSIHNNALHRAEDALGVNWITYSKPKAESSRRDQALASAIAHLYSELGLEPSDEIMAMAQENDKREAA